MPYTIERYNFAAFRWVEIAKFLTLGDAHIFTTAYVEAIADQHLRIRRSGGGVVYELSSTVLSEAQ